VHRTLDGSDDASVVRAQRSAEFLRTVDCLHYRVSDQRLVLDGARSARHSGARGRLAAHAFRTL
jgi:hypothetical protein